MFSLATVAAKARRALAARQTAKARRSANRRNGAVLGVFLTLANLVGFAAPVMVATPAHAGGAPPITKIRWDNHTYDLNFTGASHYTLLADLCGSQNASTANVTVLQQGTYGSVLGYSDGRACGGTKIEYTPYTLGYYGPSDTVVLQITGTDGGVSTVTHTITLNVASTPAPNNADLGLNVGYGQGGSVAASSSNPWQSSGISAQPAHGSASASGLTMSYSPAAGYYGADSFGYYLQGVGGTTYKTVYVNVGTPPAPGAADTSITTAYNTQGAVGLPGSGVVTQYILNTNPAHGSAVISGGAAYYTPTTSYYGADSFTYYANGPGGNSSVQTVYVSVGNPPAPTAADTSMGVGYNTSATIGLPISGDYATAQGVSAPAKGSVSYSGTSVTYTATWPNYGADSFTYRATNPGGASATKTVNVTIANPPKGFSNSGSMGVGYNTAGSYALPMGGDYAYPVLAVAPTKGSVSFSGNTVTYTPTTSQYGADSFQYTARNPSGDSTWGTINVTIANPPKGYSNNGSMSVGYNTAGSYALPMGGDYAYPVLATAPTKGSVGFSGNTVTYTPNAGTYGADSFQYTARNPSGDSAWGTINVTTANPPGPTVAAKSLNSTYNGSGSVDLAPSGVWSTIAFPVAPTKGTLSLSGSTVTYTPTAGTYGADSFTFTATGPGGTSSPATVTVTTANPPAPTVAAKSLNSTYNGSGSVDLAPSGVWSSIAFPVAPTKGTLNRSGSVVTYTPTAGTYGSDSFTFTATGPGGTSSPATVTVTTANPPAPTVAAKSLNSTYNGSGSVDLAPSGVWSTIAFPSAPTKGTLSRSGSVVTYTPNAGTYGADSFTFTATGPGGTSSPATVSVTTAVPAAPTANALSTSTAYNTAKAGAVTASGVVNAGGYALVTNPTHGSLSWNGDATFTYTPTAGWVGSDSFTFTATGPGGTSSPATVTITTNAPPAPTVSAKSLNSTYNGSGSVDLAPSGVWSSIAFPVAPTKGTLSRSGSVVTYTPNAGTFGSDSFTYTATGAGGTSGAATVTVTTANPPAPTANNLSLTTPYQTAGSVTLTGGGVRDTWSISTAPSHGSVNLVGDVATYTPAAGYYGADDFYYRANGPGGSSAPARVGVVVSVPPAPVSHDGTLAIDYGQPGSMNLPIDGVVLSTVVTQPGNGSVTISGQRVTYTPALGFYGTDSFTYIATGPGGDSSEATISVTVGLPPAPTATGRSASVPYETATAITLAGTGVIGAYTISSAPAHGQVSIVGNTANFTPAAGYYGPDSFAFVAVGPGGTSSPATVSVTVGLPAAPTVGDTTLSTPFQSTGTKILPASGVFTALNITGQPAHGSASITGTTLTYTPAAGYYGPDAVTYTATGPGGTSGQGTVNITVGLPAIPSVYGSTIATGYDTAITSAVTVSGYQPALAVSQNPTHGTAAIDGLSVRYTPAPGYYGADAFKVTASNAGGTSAPATISVTVGLPAAPTVADAGISTLFDTASSATLSVGGVYDSVSIASAPAHGTATLNGLTATFTPTAGYYGADSFKVRAVGPGGASALATVSVTVGLPGAPAANATTLSTGYEDAGSVTLAGSGVFSSFELVSQPSHGSATLSGDQATYTPAAGYYGPDAFTFRVVGPGGASAPAPVNVTVGLPGAPVASAASLTTGFETTKDATLSASGVVSTYALAGAPAHGQVTVTGNKATYTPAAGYFGPDAFTYTATGPGGTSAPATISVTVGLPAAPTVSAVTLSTPFETAGNARLLASGVIDSLALASQPQHGSATLAGDVVTYTPASGYFGSDSFTYTATGPAGSSSPATVSVTVGLPGIPVVSPSSIETDYQTAGSTTLTATGVFSGFTIEEPPQHGSVSVTGNKATYTPAAGYFGPDSFTYTATGPGGVAAPATVAVVVQQPPAPVASAQAVPVSYETAAPVTIAATGIVASYALAAQPQHGTASLTGNRVIYTPASGYYGPDAFSFTATGPGGTSAPAAVSLTVGLPAVPTVGTTNLTTPFQTGGTTILPAWGVFTALNITGQPAHGSASITGTTLTYTPAAGYYGPDAVTYTATGPGGTSGQGTVNITVGLPAIPSVYGSTIATGYDTAITSAVTVSGYQPALAVSQNPTHGTAVIDGLSVRYTPASGYHGADAFKVTASNAGGTSAPATISVTVGLPAAPTVADAGISTLFDTASSATLSVGGVYDSVSIASAPAHGTAALNGLTATFTPTAGYYGADSFKVRAVGPGGASALATVSVTVGLPGAPAANATTLSTAYQGAAQVKLAGQGVFSSFELVSQPSHGSATLSGDQATYTPAAGYYGPDAFTFRVVGPGGASAPAPVNVTVGLPGAPVASAASLTTGFETTKDATLSASGVVSTYALAGAPAHGQVTVTGDKATYTPAAGYFGPDAFTYTATGPGGTSAPAKVSVTVGLPSVPTVSTVTLTTPYETAGNARLLASGVIDSLALASQPQHGSATLAGDVVTYTPAAGYFGSDSFAFTATGPGGTSLQGQVNVTVGLPGIPVVSPSSIATAYEKAGVATLTATGVHSGFSVLEAPKHGAVTIADNKATYTPAAGYFGPDSFTYTAKGPGGTSAPATVAVVVQRPGVPTLDLGANGGVIVTPFETPGTLNLSVGGVYTSVELADAPVHGSAALTGTAVTFTPAKGFYGDDSFTVTATGPGGTSLPAKVSVKVGTPAPVAKADTMTTKAGEAVTSDLAENDTGPISELAVVKEPEHGKVTISGTKATYTPAAEFYGEDVFSYRATGAGGTSDAVTVTVTVAGGPKPEGEDHTATGLAGTPIVFHVTEGMTNGPFKSVRVLAGAKEKTSAVAAARSLSAASAAPKASAPSYAVDGRIRVEGLDVIYTPPVDFSGEVEFQYVVENAFGESAPASLLAVVNPMPIPAADKTAEVLTGKSVTVDLTEGAEGGPFKAAAVVAISPKDAGEASIRQEGERFLMTFVPKGADGREVLVTYTLSNAWATSLPATVKITVNARPDPSRDPEVTGLINAQTQAAYRFGETQLSNVGSRLESLHGRGVRRNNVGLSLVPLENLRNIPGENPAMERMRDYFIRTSNVDPDAPATRPGGSAANREVDGAGASWWVSGALDLGSKKSREDRAGFRFTTDGISAGFDVKPAANLVLGLGGGYGHDASRVGEHGTKSEADSASVFAYGSFQPTEKVFFDAIVGYGKIDFTSQRYLTANGGMVTGEREGSEIFASFKGGWERRGPRLHFSPYGGIEVVSATLGAFTEEGDDTWALNFAKQSSQQVSAVLGIHGDYLYRLRTGALSPTFRFEYRRELRTSEAASVSYADWADSPNYAVDVSPFDSSRFVAGAGLQWRSKRGLEGAVEYEASGSGDGFSGRLKISGSTKF